MKIISHKTILLLVVYTLALNPVSMVFAGQLGGLLSSTASTDCKMEGMVHKETMEMGHSSELMKMADKSDCKCNKDCEQGACGQQCAECGHFFAGMTAFTPELSHTHFTHNKITSDLRHQQPMLMHYRPPKILNS